MELTTRGRYAVMAMADLAKYGEGEHGDAASMPLSAIAERQHLSVAYLEQLFGKLRRAGLVDSERGRAGGYRLARPADAIMVADIMSAVDEDTRMTRCHGVLPKAGQQHASSGCVGESRCLTHGLWEALGEQIRAFLGRVSLADVLSGHIPVEHFGPRANTARLQLGTGTVTQTQ